MLLYSSARLPLNEFDTISEEEAQKLVGQESTVKFEDRVVGTSKVVNVDRRSPNEVWLNMEMEVEDHATATRLKGEGWFM